MYFLEKIGFLQCALRMDSSGQNSIFKRQNRELDPFWPWWLVPAINRTARHTSQANMGSRDIHKPVLVISFHDFQLLKHWHTARSIEIVPRGGPLIFRLMLMNSRGGPPFGGCMWMNSRGIPPFGGCMLMNSRGGPPFGRLYVDET